ncbi:CDP-alcohol phosphatidyltransferase family protein [Falcatimonas sp. MSJ-15]|nr:CDP-alcohol phosphatidyltransferase family protein [Falcatimonas sp. MSJ-15]
MKKELKKQIFSIPNILSYIRFILAFLFAYVYLNANETKDYYIAAIIIAISGLTDCMDGFIARKFNMITEIGKIVDPIADKVTQGMLALCLMSRYNMMIPLLVLFFVKESYMGIAGLKVIRQSGENHGAMWYGKISTVVLYAVMLILLIFPDINVVLADVLIAVCIFFMALSFVMYIMRYNKILRESGE